MKSSVTVICTKGHSITVPTVGTQEIGTVSCEECGESGYVLRLLGNEVSRRIFERAWTELKNGDFTLTILLSAVAVDCELSYLFFKWKRVDAISESGPTPFMEEEWSEQWRKLGMKSRLDTVSAFLTGHKFDEYIEQNAPLFKSVDYSAKGCTSLKDYLYEEFFHKRNRIVHAGEIDYGAEDGERCFELAMRLFTVLKQMDSLRIKAMDTKHIAERN